MKLPRRISRRLNHRPILKGRACAHSSRQSGQSLIEFVLLLSISVGFALSVNTMINRKLTQGYGVLSAELERSIQTGGFKEAPTLWAN